MMDFTINCPYFRKAAFAGKLYWPPKALATAHIRGESTQQLQNLPGFLTLTSCPVAMSIAV